MPEETSFCYGTGSLLFLSEFRFIFLLGFPFLSLEKKKKKLLPPPVLQWFQTSCQAKVTQFQFHVLINEEVT